MSNNEKTSSAIHQLGKVPANTRPPEQLRIPLARKAYRGSASLSDAPEGFDLATGNPEEDDDDDELWKEIDPMDLPF